jgi:hypothetical protein
MKVVANGSKVVIGLKAAMAMVVVTLGWLGGRQFGGH